MIPPALADADAELLNWARWGHQDDGPMPLGEPTIWRAWLSRHGRIAGWGLTAEEREAEARGEIIRRPPDDDPLPIDDAAAEQADRQIRYLRDHIPRAYVALHKHYYQRRHVRDDNLHEALRHYADLS